MAFNIGDKVAARPNVYGIPAGTKGEVSAYWSDDETPDVPYLYVVKFDGVDPNYRPSKGFEGSLCYPSEIEAA